MKKRPDLKIKAFFISLIIVFGIAFIGTLFTSPFTNSDWYNENKPSITPPSFVFPIVWNILYFLIAISLYLSFTSSKTKKQRKTIAIIFGINLLLNALWSILFFKFQNPLLAFIDVIIMITTVILMIKITYKINKISSYLLIPYLLWISFASYLNYLFI